MNKTTEISPKRSLLNIPFKEMWDYRDLVLILVKRDFVSNYKQTILGPLWFFIQPLFTTLVFTVVFAKLGKIPTDGLPPMLFYMCGIIFWNYFSDCMKKNSTTFIDNKGVFGKVYFPRLIIPISVIISNIIRFGIQFLLFIGIYLYFVFNGAPLQLNFYILLVPINIILLGIFGLGLGILITSLTIKYRDLRFLVDFGVQLAMYATIIFPVSSYPEKYKWLAHYNPFIPLIESTKLGILGSGTFNLESYIFSIILNLVVLAFGIIIFNKAEQNFMDIV